MASTLFTCSLDPENRHILEAKKKKDGWKLGETVNTLIATFGLLPDDIRNELLSHVKQQLRTLIEQMDQAGTCELAALSANAQKYLQIAAYLNNGQSLSLESIKNELLFKKITIQNGILICPKNYVAVNPEEALTNEYACVLECRNAALYGVPEYLIHCDRKYGCDFDDSYREMLIQKVIDYDPDFQKIIDIQVDPIMDPEQPGRILNATAYQHAPTIGFYNIYEHGDPIYPVDYRPSNGAEIIRQELID